MTEFITVVILHMFAVMSPGPDFALVTRQSIRYGRKVALLTSAGIGTGILFHSFLAISGIIFLISSNNVVMMILKIICSCYLIYLGGKSLLKSLNIEGVTILVNEHDRAFVIELKAHITVLHLDKILAEDTLKDIEKNSNVRNAYLGNN